jgi:hypothetical protein
MKKQTILFLCLTLSTILSAQVSKTVNCTAGALSSLLSASEKSTVTDLTLTGTIDARDFMTMRDNMPALAKIDMGTVTIVAYSSNMANQIPAGAFCDTTKNYQNTTLISIVMPTGTTSIGSSAFDGCKGLTGSLTIPNSVTSIGRYAFRFCSGFAGSLTISNSVTTIGDEAFYACTGFTGSLTIPNSVTSIGENAFENCSGFSGSLTIGNSVTSIGSGAFLLCTGLTGSLTIPSSVTSLGGDAFDCCYSLDKLSIPNSVTSIGTATFYNCYGLTSIKLESQIPVNLTLSFSVFDGINKSSCKLYVPKGSKAAYQSADQWKDFLNIVEYDPTGINDITTSGVSLYVADGQLHIKNAPAGEQVSITAMSGMVVYTGVITTDELSVLLPQHGVYIVTIGSKSQKVAY